MTELATASEYAKEYLPGYTGHVPSKQERFGATAGQIKREILGDRGVHPIVIQNHVKQDETARIYSSKFTPAVDKNKVVYGNMSRFAKNWVCGPNHNIRHQHVPHYTGHIKGLVSENLFAATYGNCTANAIGKKHTIGHNVEPK